ncbi:MAG: cellulose biosynthesis cyclic di-GMP-binding regulatory protein BcsB [Sutterellaceae bacterium]|nr:cellulose biosynthesis cyclic di-GMP-binding regulatory protein BcsB [Sutterellaceae bacterium]
MTRLTTAALAIAFGWGIAQNAHAQTNPTAQWRTDVIAVTNDSINLMGLVPGGKTTAIKLTGANPVQYFDIGVKSDEMFSRVTLELDYTPSPSLLPGTSQINVYLNGELQSTNALDKDSIGKASHLSIPINAKALKNQNQISVELVGHYRLVCENEASSAVWLDIGPTSTLAIEKQLLRLGNDLSQLPKPFVDTSVATPATVPFVLAAGASDTQKTAAAVLAGYFGSISGWRGANFPVYNNEVPARNHFVVLATNDNRPDFLNSLPAFEGPQLVMVDAPESLFQKMLVVGGKTDEDVLTAARALTVRGQIFMGPKTDIKDFKLQAAQAAYTAPNWINIDEAVPLSALMQYPEQLTARGKTVSPVHVTMRMAPDLFATKGSEASVDLLYRYSKPEVGQAAQLRTTVNGFLADSENLSPEAGRGVKHFKLPVQPGNITPLAGARDGLSFTNDLGFEAAYQAAAREGTPENCRAATLSTHQIQIEPSSMLQFKGFYHYATLPEIGLFTQGGFPFSQYADLSQTAVVVDSKAPAHQLTTMLNSVGRLGAITGMAPTHVTVVNRKAATGLRGKDLLIVGDLPAGITQINQETARQLNDNVSSWLETAEPEKIAQPQAKADAETEFLSAGFAAIVSVANPVDSARTAVALLSEGDQGAHLINTRLANPSDLATAKGGTVFLSEDNITGFAPEKTYTVGSLPWFERVWLSLADRPFLLVFFALLAAVTVGAGIFFYMRRWIRQRGTNA